jgi:hypothetical protein
MRAQTADADPDADESPGRPTMSDRAAVSDESPHLLDTYAMVYSFLMLFLVPGSIAVGRLPFRVYTLPYVSLVTIPFVLAIVITFMTDSRDSLRVSLVRTAVLTPIVIMSGVTVLFTSALLLLPINRFLGPEYRSVTTPLAALLLVALASPMARGIWVRLRAGLSARTAVQALVMALALGLVGVVVYISVGQVGTLDYIARKDVLIYIVGGLVWYGPAFGFAAGAWRRLGLL